MVRERSQKWPSLLPWESSWSFLNSRSYLNNEVLLKPDLRQKFTDYLLEAKEKYSTLDVEMISKVLQYALREGQTATEPSAAVQLAERCAADLASKPLFPELRPYTPFESEFQEHLRKLNE